MLSATRLGINSRLPRTSSNCSGFSTSAISPPLMELRVVSLPPTIRSALVPMNSRACKLRVASECASIETRSKVTFDLVSMLAHSEATRNLQAREFIGTSALLIVGGNDTTRNSMSGGLMALVENPEQFELVRGRRELIPNLVAESIRYHTPVLHMRRTARNDVELAGRRIARGDKVVMWYISGNRDETKIDHADEFIIDRAKPRQHLAFGAGIHLSLIHI